MTVFNPPVWMQAGEYSAEHDRLVTSMLVDRTHLGGAVPSKLEAGVVPPNSKLFAQERPTPDMTVLITEGIVIVPRLATTPPGVYICYNEGGTLVEHDPASSHPRYDIIYAHVSDSTQDGGTVNEWGFMVKKGVESPTPPVPVLGPELGSVCPLWLIKIIPASVAGTNKITNAQITDRRQFVSGLGGIHLSWGLLPAPSLGRVVYDIPTKNLQIYTGDGWEEIWTQSNISTYLAQWRPSMIFYPGTVSQFTDDTWDSLIRADDDTGPGDSGDTMEDPIQLIGVQTPSGQCMVNLSAYGRIDTAGDVGHMAVRIIRSDTNVEVAAPYIGRGPSFFSTQWNTSSVDMLYSGLPVKVPLRIAVQFQKVHAGGGLGDRVRFSKIRLTASPVL